MISAWIGRQKIIVLIVIKVINAIFDLGITYLVYLLSNKNLKTAFLYAINPVSILIFAIHGQFDAIPLFFLLLSLYLITTKKEFLAILVFSASVMTKTWPALFIVTIFKRLKTKKLILLSVLFPIVSIVVYSFLFKAMMLDILKTIISYQGLWGIWGVWGFFGHIRLRYQKLTTLLFLISFFLYSFKISRKKITSEVLALLFFFYTFTTNFSVQYLSWIMPFLTIKKPKYYWLITVSTTIFLTVTFLARFFLKIPPLQIKISGLILWIFLASIYLVVYRKKYIV